MIKILIADEIDTAGFTLLSPKKFHIKTEFGISNSGIIKKYGNYNVLVIRSIRKIDKNFLERVKFDVIATCSKGTDHIDAEYCAKKKIKILNADDSNNISAAEHTLAMILSIYKNILFSDSLVRKNRFKFYDYERKEIYGKSIGIIGFGKVGSYVGKLCRAFGMEVFANDTDIEVKRRNKDFDFKNLDFILKKCDIVTVHIPLNKKNYKFISKKKLKLIPDTSVFINTSRGDVVDEKALFGLLKEKKIKFAGLDVFSNEPFVYRGFSGLNNTLLTNHIAGKTMESRRNVSLNIFNSIKKNYS